MDRDFLAEFKVFIDSASSPIKVKIPYQRVRYRVLKHTVNLEPVSKVQTVNYSEFSYEISQDTEEAVAIELIMA